MLPIPWQRQLIWNWGPCNRHSVSKHPQQWNLTRLTDEMKELKKKTPQLQKQKKILKTCEHNRNRKETAFLRVGSVTHWAVSFEVTVQGSGCRWAQGSPAELWQTWHKHLRRQHTCVVTLMKWKCQVVAIWGNKMLSVTNKKQSVQMTARTFVIDCACNSCCVWWFTQQNKR